MTLVLVAIAWLAVAFSVWALLFAHGESQHSRREPWR